MNKPPFTLIVAPPNRLRDGLRAILNGFDGLGPIAQADDAATALQLLPVLNHAPLVIVDSLVPMDEAGMVLKATRRRHPDGKTMMLVNNQHEADAARELATDLVILKGFSTEQLVVALGKMFPHLHLPVLK